MTGQRQPQHPRELEFTSRWPWWIALGLMFLAAGIMGMALGTLLGVAGVAIVHDWAS